jgi:hypothetical protein
MNNEIKKKSENINEINYQIDNIRYFLALFLDHLKKKEIFLRDLIQLMLFLKTVNIVLKYFNDRKYTLKVEIKLKRKAIK